MARRTRSQFQFTVIELVVLAASFAVTSCLVFLLGFYVGRQVASRHGPPRESVARIPRDAAPAARGATRGEPAAGAEGAVDGVAAPSVAGEAGQAARAGQAGTDGASAARDTGSEPSAAPADGAGGPAREAPAVAGGADADRAGAGAPAVAPPSGFTVQVLATRNRKEAEGLSESLRGRDLDAFVAPVEDPSGKWYRVRIGRYHDPASARAMAERCRRELGLGQAYVSPL